MSAPRPGTAGATRTCPHCKTTILESASVCPQCRGHLRFGAEAAEAATFSPLQVEGTIPAPSQGACEYSMVLSIRAFNSSSRVTGSSRLMPQPLH